MTLDPSCAIQVRGLSKRFGDVQAVADIRFDVREGELFGFLGPNGAGKTTTINMLTGLARLDAGTVSIGGIDCTANPRAAQHLLGVVPDDSNLYPELSGFGNLCFCAALYGMERREREARARDLLETFGLTAAADRRFGGYSKGMKRKLTIAAGIIHRPPILFLDEPTTGIDVPSARLIRRILADLHAGGTTIFLTTHYIEEAERLCDRIAFIVAGRIVRLESVKDLLEPLRDTHIVQITSGTIPADVPEALAQAFPHPKFRLTAPDTLRVEANTPIPVGPLIRALEDRGIEVFEARRLRPTLEDVFVEVTGLERTVMRGEKEKAGGRR